MSRRALADTLVRPGRSRRSFLAGSAAATAGLLVATTPALAAVANGADVLPVARRRPDLLASWIRQVYDGVRDERCTPPSAARIYAHVALAAYEAVVPGMPRHRSLAGQVQGLGRIAGPRGVVDWELAMSEAIAVAALAVFADRSAPTRATIEAFAADQRAALSNGLPAVLVERSIDHGRTVGAAVAARAAADRYDRFRGRAYTPPVGPSLWVPTPPNFGSAIEPHWSEIRSFCLGDNAECRPIAPVPFSEAAGSAFFAEASVVYDTAQSLTDHQRGLAMSWRDNPDGVTGLPSGHWMRIGSDVAESRGLDLGVTAELLALLGLGLADAFTSCWTEKYETNLLRPVTYIRRVIDPEWSSFVNSPAFPEYTSGHSVGSGAAAVPPLRRHPLPDGDRGRPRTGRRGGDQGPPAGGHPPLTRPHGRGVTSDGDPTTAGRVRRPPGRGR